MAEKVEIDFTIDDDGNVSFEVKGVSGKKCLDITKDIEEALGVVTNREHTGEYYQQEVQTDSTVDQRGS